MNDLDNRKLALELYKQGESFAFITKQTGLPHYTINYLRRRANIPERISAKRPNGDSTLMLNAVRMNLQRKDVDLIEKETGISEQQLRDWYAQYNIDFDERPSFEVTDDESNDHSWPAMPADLETGD